MRAPLMLLAALLLATACSRRTVEVPVPYVVTDTVAITTHRIDSIAVRDSIYVEGQTVYREHTVTRLRLLRDTLYMTRTDTLTVPRYIERKVTTPRKWYDTAALYLGRACIIAALLWLLFLYLKRKF